VKDLAEERRIAEKAVKTFHTCPIPEITRLGRAIRRWRDAFLAYSTTARSSEGGTETVNEIVEPHRRIARVQRNRNKYRLRMLLAAGGLSPMSPPDVRRSRNPGVALATLVRACGVGSSAEARTSNWADDVCAVRAVRAVRAADEVFSRSSPRHARAGDP